MPPESDSRTNVDLRQRRRRLLMLFSANTISGFAQGITMLSIPWFLIHSDTAGKALNAQLIAFVTLASVFWGLYAGTLIDKLNRKHIFLGLNAAGLFALTIGAATGYALGEVPVAVCCAVFACTAFIFNVHYPNLYAFVQELFDKSQYGRVTSAIEIQGQITNALGMTTGALLMAGSVEMPFLHDWIQIAPWSQTSIFTLNAFTYIAALIIISQIPYQPVPRSPQKLGVFGQVAQGFAFLSKERRLMLFGVSSYMVFFSIMVLYQAVLPVYIKDVLRQKAHIMGLSEGTFAIGALTAGAVGLLYTEWVARLNKTRSILILTFGAALTFALIAFAHNSAILLIASVMLGLFNAGTRILRVTFILNSTPNAVIGRVNSFFQVVNGFLRFTFILLMSAPFFSDPHNGDHIVYALLLLSGVLLVACFGLLTLLFGPRYLITSFGEKLMRNVYNLVNFRSH